MTVGLALSIPSANTVNWTIACLLSRQDCPLCAQTSLTPFWSYVFPSSNTNGKGVWSTFLFLNRNKEEWNFLISRRVSFSSRMISYIGSETSQTNDSKRENHDQTLTHPVSASLAIQTTISLQVFLDVSLLYTYYIAFLSYMHGLLDVLVSLIGHFFSEPAFSQFLEPKFWPKKTETVLRHSYG